MLKFIVPLIILAATACGRAAEIRFDFSRYPVGQCPTGFVSVISGDGEPGNWKVVEEEVAPMLEPLTPNAPRTSKRVVLAQTAQEPTRNHFPLLLYDNEEFSDFTFTTRFRFVSGDIAQMAGVVFRAQDAKNYYVVCASALDTYVRFYKCVGGIQSTPIGRKIPIDPKKWHELKVTCKGSQILCKLDGEECLPELHDTSLTSGRLGFWTKSDAVSQFVDGVVEYTPTIPFAQKLVSMTMSKYPRLLGLKMYIPTRGGNPRLVGSNKQDDVGAFGGKVEADSIARTATYFARKDKAVEVTVPLRDRNGETIGALQILMPSFIGETEANAVNRAGIIRKYIETQMGAESELTR